MATPPFPSFFVIGAERCGVRWLRHNLDQHPDICAPPVDLHYFAQRELVPGHGSRWYRSQFGSWDGEPHLGEASPGYLAWRNRPWEVAERVHRASPDAKLVAIVRQPLDRIRSGVGRLIEIGDLPPDHDLWAAAFQGELGDVELDVIRGGVYAPNLAPYRDRFGDQLEIMLYDDLQRDPAAFYQTVLRHLGAEDSFRPPGLERVLFRGTSAAPAVPTGEGARQMYESFRENVDQLAAWIGRDLSAWDPVLAGA